jgi:DNA polymerase-3 subunit delta'
MQFSAIPGLNDLKKQLIHAQDQGKIAHAQLFSGLPGTAALPMALAYTTYLFCENRSELDSCGVCPNCQKIAKNIHPDVYFHFPKLSAEKAKFEKELSAALVTFRAFLQEHPYGILGDWASFSGSENKNLIISREDSRQMVKNVSMRSVEGGYKVLIIWCPETMNINSANAILKILEEPPSKTLYLLVTYSYETLLSTITSRAQLIAIPVNTEHEIKEYLLKQNIAEQQAEQASRYSDGRIREALHYLEDTDNQEIENFRGWMLDCWKNDHQAAVARSEAFGKSGKNNQKNELGFALSLIRNALLIRGKVKIKTTGPEEEGFITKFAKQLNEHQLEYAYTLLNTAIERIGRNGNPKIIHLNLSLRLMNLMTK